MHAHDSGDGSAPHGDVAPLESSARTNVPSMGWKYAAGSRRMHLGTKLRGDGVHRHRLAGAWRAVQQQAARPCDAQRGTFLSIQQGPTYSASARFTFARRQTAASLHACRYGRHIRSICSAVRQRKYPPMSSRNACCAWPALVGAAAATAALAILMPILTVMIGESSSSSASSSRQRRSRLEAAQSRNLLSEAGHAWGTSETQTESSEPAHCTDM